MKYFREHKFVTFLLIVFIILLGILMGKNHLKKEQAEKSLLGGIEVEDYEEYMKGFSNTPSDIAGKSIYDKYQMGLQTEDGSDSDHDGLSDKEEIEIYGTDPLQASTSGDLYTDGYKVENSMDLFTKHEYQSSEEFTYNECPEVQLTASNPLDFMAVVTDCTSRYSLSDFGIDEVYQGFKLYNFSGIFSINMMNIYDDFNITEDDIEIWIYKGEFLVYGLSDMEKCKYTTNEDVLTLDYAFNDSSSYYVYVTGKTTLLNSIMASHTNGLQINGSADEEVVFLALGSPIISNLKVYYPEREFADEEAELEDKARAMYGDDFVYTPLPLEKIKKKYEFYKNVLPALETKDGIINNNWALALFAYWYHVEEPAAMSANAGSADGENIQRVYYNNYHTEFDPYADELPFQNFESEYATGGNCAGIAYLTTYLFNTGAFPSAGEYNGIAWDISNDNENNTLVDRGLSDYKTKDFVDDNSSSSNNYIGNGLTSGENEFVKMIGACWRESNDKMPKLTDKMVSNEQGPDWEVAESMMNYLDQGKIPYIGLYLNNGTGHAINVYDYYFTNENEVIFRVYDCNAPQNYADPASLNCDGFCYLLCEKVLRDDGTYRFSYLYYPIKDNIGYMASSDYDLMRKSSIIVADENFNSLY